MFGAPKDFIRKILAKDLETGWFMELQEVASNSIFEKHQHGSDEWVYVIEGELEDEFGKYPAGTFKINTKDSVHTPQSKNGCKLIVVKKADYKSSNSL